MKNIKSILSVISDYRADSILSLFESQLKKSVLDQRRLNIFFSTLWPFYRETPLGILSLSLRLCDEWMRINEWEATSKAAYVLMANCDEFGLSESHQSFQKTHHQLFLLSANHFRIDESILLSNNFVLTVGKKMGAVSYDFYRKESVAAGLGFHLASEYTSFLEFSAFLSGFLSHRAEYRLTFEENPVVTFFEIHTRVEPLHQKQSEAMIAKYLEKNANAYDDVLAGVHAYFAAYCDLFQSLNKELFCAG